MVIEVMKRKKINFYQEKVNQIIDNYMNKLVKRDNFLQIYIDSLVEEEKLSIVYSDFETMIEQIKKELLTR